MTVYHMRVFAGLVLLAMGSAGYASGVRSAVRGGGWFDAGVSLFEILVGAFIVATGVKMRDGKAMTMHDDTLGLRLLGEVQELRAALERLNDRAAARALKSRLITLHDASSGVTVAPEVGRIVDEFFEQARAKILKDFGTSAWEEPETIEEAKARMGRLPSAPGPGVLDRVHERETPPLTDEQLDGIARAADTLKSGAVQLQAQEVRSLVGEVRRLRSDEWLLRAADKISSGFDSEVGLFVTAEEMVTILRKHRDGKA